MLSDKKNQKLAGGLVILLIIVMIAVVALITAHRKRAARDKFSSCASCGGDGTSLPLITPNRTIRRGEWVGGRGPYNLQLYDRPYYYPYYEAKDYMSAWDNTGRCVAYCSASEDGGCAVSCR
jgi:hypothetical protein